MSTPTATNNQLLKIDLESIIEVSEPAIESTSTLIQSVCSGKYETAFEKHITRFDASLEPCKCEQILKPKRL